MTGKGYASILRRELLRLSNTYSLLYRWDMKNLRCSYWLDVVQDNLERSDYDYRAIGESKAFEALVTCKTESEDGACLIQKTAEVLQHKFSRIVESLEEIRASCISYWSIDPEEGTGAKAIHLQETSDSYDTDNDGDCRYHNLRETLQSFKHDPSRRTLRTAPIHDQRLRKEIRAWARLLQYGCLKLTCSSMLLHKDKSELPRRRRKKYTTAISSTALARKPQGCKGCRAKRIKASELYQTKSSTRH